MEADLLIVGGGINGVGIAADAAGRGLSVILCEQEDLANGSSSESTKLIHGGLRYLEYGKFALVHEALQERTILLKRAPHLVHPLLFIFPHNPSMRPKWQIYLGFKLYDFLAHSGNLPPSHLIDLTKLEYGKSLEAGYRDGFSYSDCQSDDARLVVSNAILAREKGAQILTRTKCVDAKRYANHWLLTLRNESKEIEVKAKAVVNATGAWLAQVSKEVLHIETQAQCRLVKGSHIVISKFYEGNYGYILENTDKRIIFSLPFHEDYNLIGTTDLSFNQNPAEAEISEEEINYLCESVNRYFKHKIKRTDIGWSYSGVRSLYDDQKSNPSSVTREHKIELSHGNEAPLISLFGGKLTTYRALASEVLAKLKPYFPKLKPEWTQNAFLPGGDLGMSFIEFVAHLEKTYPWLPKSLALRYARSYGSRVSLILKSARSLAEMGLNFGAGLYQQEVDYLIENEWATTADDILWRRTKLGLKINNEDIKKLSHYLKELKS